MTNRNLLEKIEVEFSKDVKHHKMDVRVDIPNSNVRHIVFSRNNSYNKRFEVITSPGILTIAGDMGVFVFCHHSLKEVLNMFGSNSPLPIDYIYSKLTAADKWVGQMVFSHEKWDEWIISESEYFESDTEKEKFLNFFNSSDYPYNDESAMRLLEDYDSLPGNEYNIFDDFDKRVFMDYSYHFVWCCFALRYAAKKYFEMRQYK